MNKIKPITLILLAFCITFLSCQSGEFKLEDIVGHWKVSKWEVEKTGQLRNNKMDMTFKADKTYEIDYGDELEKGRFWIANDYLHTVEDKKSEKKVLILKLNKDTFNFEMNRGGELENVLLVK